jgi:putative spermidine/putrescine transport system substrate-binding protein
MKKIGSKFQFSIFAIFVAILSLTMMIVGFPTGAQAGQDNELVIQSWGGAEATAEKEAFYDPFTEKTGIKITFVEAAGDTLGKVAAQVRSGNVEWDLINGYGLPQVLDAARKGLLEKIDYSIVTDTKDLMPGSVTEYGLGQEVDTVMLAYNTHKWPGDNHPRTWADFFDVKKFPGPRTMSNWGTPEDNLICALLADGVPPDKLVPIDYDRAFKKLDQIKPYVKVWYTSGDQLIKILQDEEVVLAQAFDGRAKYAKQYGAPINLTWNQGIFFICYWNVVKGAPHKKAAMQFLNFICRPELQAIWTNYIWYSSANRKSLKFLPPYVQKDQAVYPDNLKKLIRVPNDKTVAWLAAHMDEMNEKFNSWLMR